MHGDANLAAENARLRARVAELEAERERTRDMLTMAAECRHMLDHLPAVAWTTDTQLRVTSARGLGLASLGTDPESLRGVALSEYFGTDDPEFPPIAAHRRALAGVSASYELEWGGFTWHYHIEPFQGDDGAVGGVIGVALDVTQERRAQAEMATYHDLVTHDVANFATTLLGLVERLLLASDPPLGQAQEELLLRARRQAYSMSRLAENARLMRRLREKGLPAPEGPVDVSEALHRAVDTVRSIYFDRPFEVVIECEAGLQVLGPALLESVFINLVDNAVRHGPRQGKSVVRVRVAADPKEIVLSVRGGQPPDPRALQRIFERYARGQDSTGTGLGLALVREIVSRAGGSVEAAVRGDGAAEAFEIVLRLPTA